MAGQALELRQHGCVATHQRRGSHLAASSFVFQLLLQYSGDGINRVLRLLASKDRHPVALYCTAGVCRRPWRVMLGAIYFVFFAYTYVAVEAVVHPSARGKQHYKMKHHHSSLSIGGWRDATFWTSPGV